MTPEISDSFLLTHDHVGVWTLTRHLRERCERSIGNCFHQRRMAHERDAFELSVQVATAVKRAAIEWADDTVVVNQAHHCHRMNRALGQKLQHFRCVVVRQALDLNRFERGRQFTFVGFWIAVLVCNIGLPFVLGF